MELGKTAKAKLSGSTRCGAVGQRSKTEESRNNVDTVRCCSG